MVRCPNCNYILVLLERRRKYKCAKCGRLFAQKDIEDKDFVVQNKQRRTEANKEMKKIRKKITRNKKGLHKVISDINKRKNKKIKPEKDKETYNAEKREYWAKNREHLLEKRRENYKKRKEEILAQQRLYNENHKIENRIKHLRDRQKHLALQIFGFSL